jgi:hypothetical protein
MMEGWNVTYRIKNFGQTPAHNVVVRSVVKMVDWPVDKSGFSFPYKSERLGTLAPRGDYLDFADDVVTGATPDEMRNKLKAVYLVGTVTYDIVYEPSARVTNFRYLIGGDVGCDGDDMYTDDSGNDAT